MRLRLGESASLSQRRRNQISRDDNPFIVPLSLDLYKAGNALSVPLSPERRAATDTSLSQPINIGQLGEFASFTTLSALFDYNYIKDNHRTIFSEFVKDPRLFSDYGSQYYGELRYRSVNWSSLEVKPADAEADVTTEDELPDYLPGPGQVNSAHWISKPCTNDDAGNALRDERTHKRLSEFESIPQTLRADADQNNQYCDAIKKNGVEEIELLKVIRDESRQHYQASRKENAAIIKALQALQDLERPPHDVPKHARSEGHQCGCEEKKSQITKKDAKYLLLRQKKAVIKKQQLKVDQQIRKLLSDDSHGCRKVRKHF